MSTPNTVELAHSLGLVWMDMARLRELRTRWDAVGYTDAVARKIAVLQSPADDPTGAGQVYLALTDHRDAAAETWGLNQCRRLGLAKVHHEISAALLLRVTRDHRQCYRAECIQTD